MSGILLLTETRCTLVVHMCTSRLLWSVHTYYSPIHLYTYSPIHLQDWQLKCMNAICPQGLMLQMAGRGQITCALLSSQWMRVMDQIAVNLLRFVLLRPSACKSWSSKWLCGTKSFSSSGKWSATSGKLSTAAAWVRWGQCGCQVSNSPGLIPQSHM